MLIQRMARRFAGTIYDLGHHFVLHPELLERCKQAMLHIKTGDIKQANLLMNELPATKAIWAEALK